MSPGVEFVSDEVKKFAQRLRAGEGKNIWLMGGGETIASFLDAQAVDELIITVVPTLIGELMTSGDARRQGNLMKAIFQMTKPDIAAMKEAYEG